MFGISCLMLRYNVGLYQCLCCDDSRIVSDKGSLICDLVVLVLEWKIAMLIMLGTRDATRLAQQGLEVSDQTYLFDQTDEIEGNRRVSEVGFTPVLSNSQQGTPGIRFRHCAVFGQNMGLNYPTCPNALASS